MVREFPKFSRFSLIFFKKSPFFQVFQVSLSCTNPARSVLNLQNYILTHTKAGQLLPQPILELAAGS